MAVTGRTESKTLSHPKRQCCHRRSHSSAQRTALRRCRGCDYPSRRQIAQRGPNDPAAARISDHPPGNHFPAVGQIGAHCSQLVTLLEKCWRPRDGWPPTGDLIPELTSGSQRKRSHLAPLRAYKFLRDKRSGHVLVLQRLPVVYILTVNGFTGIMLGGFAGT
jgi:hypothetical protein